MKLLRPYQEALSLAVRKAIALYRTVVLCVATGGGKTIIASDIISRAANKKIKTVFLTDRKRILSQAKKQFTEHGIKCELLEATTDYLWITDCYVAMVETFYRRYSRGWFNGIDIGLIVVDEAHMDSFSKVIKMFPNAYIIGLTATPVSSGKNPLNKLYKHIIVGEPVSKLIEQGFLVPSIDIGHNQMLELMKQAGEYTAASQLMQFSQHRIDERMMKLWAKHAPTKQTLIFNINVEHNNQVVKMFRDNGIEAAGVDSKTPDRDRIDAEFQEGKIQILCNVGIHTKGSDFPEVGCVIANHSTMSLAKYIQEVGRGARPFKGKENFIFIDMGNNLPRHGSYNEDIDWLSIFKDDNLDKRTSVKKVKLCPNCYAYLLNPFIPNCTVCKMDLTRVKLLTLESQMPPELANKDISKMTFKELQIYGKFKGYSPRWAFMYKFKGIKR